MLTVLIGNLWGIFKVFLCTFLFSLVISFGQAGYAYSNYVDVTLTETNEQTVLTQKEENNTGRKEAQIRMGKEGMVLKPVSSMNPILTEMQGEKADDKNNRGRVIVAGNSIITESLHIKTSEVIIESNVYVNEIHIPQQEDFVSSLEIQGNVEKIILEKGSKLLHMKISGSSSPQIVLEENAVLECIMFDEMASAEILLQKDAVINQFIDFSSNEIVIEGTGTIEELLQRQNCSVIISPDIIQGKSEILIPEAIHILEEPEKRMYSQGEALDTTGMVVQSIYKINDVMYESLESTYQCSPNIFRLAGKQKVIVDICGRQDDFTVEVKGSEKPSIPRLSLRDVLWNITEDSQIATWDLSERAENITFCLSLYQNKNKITEIKTKDTSIDLTEMIQEYGDGTYWFMVQAIGDNVHFLDSPIITSNEYNYIFTDFPEITGFEFQETPQLIEGEENVMTGKIAGTFCLPQGGTAPYQYELRKNEEDNDSFEIIGNQLLIKNQPLYGGKYNITVVVKDSRGKEFEKDITITVLKKMPIPEIYLSSASETKGGLYLTMKENFEEAVLEQIDKYIVVFCLADTPSVEVGKIELQKGQHEMEVLLRNEMQDTGFLTENINYVAKIQTIALSGTEYVNSNFSEYTKAACASPLVEEAITGEFVESLYVPGLFVSWDTSAVDLPLPSDVEILVDTGDEWKVCFAPVVWDTENYNKRKRELQTLTGTIYLPEGITNDSDVSCEVWIDILVCASSNTKIQCKAETEQVGMIKIIDFENVVMKGHMTVDTLTEALESTDGSIQKLMIMKLEDNNWIVKESDDTVEEGDILRVYAESFETECIFQDYPILMER